MGYSFIEQSKRDGSLVLYHDYRRWNHNFSDLSGNGNDGTPSNVWFGGGGVQFLDPSGYIEVADAPELQLTQGSLFMLGTFTNLERTNSETSARLISKRDAGGLNYEWILDSTPDMDWYDGVNTRNLNIEHRGARSLGVTFRDGAAPEGYVDGLSQGLFNDVIVCLVNDAPLFIGNWYQFNRSTYNVIQAVLIFNDGLSDTEMAACHGELLSLPGGEH